MRKIVVATVILNENDEILLLQRASDKSWAGCWNFPGGKYDATDSDLMSAAAREAQEEAGITVSNLEFMGKVKYKNFDMYIYSTKTYEGEVEINHESDAFVWVDSDKLSEYKFPMDGTINGHIHDAIMKLAGDKK